MQKSILIKKRDQKFDLDVKQITLDDLDFDPVCDGDWAAFVLELDRPELENLVRQGLRALGERLEHKRPEGFDKY